jgi:hypothetical protein
MVSDSRVLREVFGSWREEVTGEWNLIICTLLTKTTHVMKSTRMRQTVHVASVLEKINTYRILLAKPEGKSSVGSPERR